MEDFALHECKPVTACIDKNSYIEQDKPTNMEKNVNLVTAPLNYSGEANLVTDPLNTKKSNYEGSEVNCLVAPCPTTADMQTLTTSIPIDVNPEVSTSSTVATNPATKQPYKVPNIAILAPLMAFVIGVYIAYKSGKKILGKALIVVIAMIIGGMVSRASILSANKERLQA